jgi:hypothetical protein
VRLLSGLLFAACLLTLTPARGFAGQGWYLLIPSTPRDSAGQLTVEVAAPFHRWEHVDSYDSAAECRAEMFARKRIASERAAEVGRSPDARTQVADGVRAIFIAWERARCIASDDPRLKQ